MQSIKHLDISRPKPSNKGMRTTLNLDDDVLIAARSLASEQNRTLGEVISALARQALAVPPSPEIRNGFSRISG